MRAAKCRALHDECITESVGDLSLDHSYVSAQEYKPAPKTGGTDPGGSVKSDGQEVQKQKEARIKAGQQH
jgi:hypothetical protein